MTQKQVLEILKTGANVFLTGEPGAGKTYVLNEYLRYLSACGIQVAVTASTGIAATHVGGVTIHSWSGIGARDTFSDRDIDLIAQKEKNAKHINKARVLVIDEISMLSGDAFDAVDRICRTVRGNGDAFGGLQVVVVGDFFQLPPIAQFGMLPRFAFESMVWGTSGFIACYIDERHRHEDELLISLLSSIRRGEVEEDHYTLLSEQKEIAYADIEPTRLFTHNKDVDSLNNDRLKKLGGKMKRFTMKGTGSKVYVETLRKNCLSPEMLELCEGAMVICTKNNFEVGYVNGTLGTVIGWSSEGYPKIETVQKEQYTIKPATWQVMEEGRLKGEITQIPLRLAWAITVHKSQGMSLDAVEIDLRNAFAYGQGYVALSRVRTLAGMKLLGVNANALQVDPRVIKIDERFRASSLEAARIFEAIDPGELRDMHERFITASGGKIPKNSEELDAGSGVSPIKNIPKDTLSETESMLRSGKRLSEIARERSLTHTTVWGHVEKLFSEQRITLDEVLPHMPEGTVWGDVFARSCEAFELCGTEKLKPVYDRLNEEVPYEVLRIARVLFCREGE